MTTSYIGGRIGLVGLAIVLMPSVSLGQVEMKLPRMWGSTPGGGLNVQPMRVYPMGQAPQFAPRGAHDLVHTRNSSRSSSSAGSRVRASVSNDGFSAELHVGSDVGLRDHLLPPVLSHQVHEVHERLLHNGHEVPVHLPGYGWRYYPYLYGYGYGYSNSYYSTIDGSYYPPRTSVQPQLPPPAPEPAEPLTDEEIAALEVRDGDASYAVDLYRKILRDAPDDAVSMRGLAIALLKDARFEEGVAMMAMAYRTDSLLADEALQGEFFYLDADVRDLLLKCVLHANKTKFGSAWLTVAVLMQAEGRDSTALKMVKRADDLGLDTVIVDSLTRALGG